MTDGGGRRFSVGAAERVEFTANAEDAEDDDGEDLTEYQETFVAEVRDHLPDDADVSDEEMRVTAELADLWESHDDLPAVAASLVMGDADASEAANALGVNREADDDDLPPGVVTGDAGDGVPEEQQRYLHDGGTRTAGVGVNYAGRGTGQASTDGAESEATDEVVPGVVTATEDDSDEDDRGGVNYAGRGAPVEHGQREDDDALPRGVVTADEDEDDEE